jgi:5'-phosphate synthase pdxT subunit
LVGVLALQGDFEAHGTVLRRLGASVREVRTPAHLEGLHGLVIPGGESTTMTLGIEREGLAEPLRELAAHGGTDGATRTAVDGAGARGTGTRGAAEGTTGAGGTEASRVGGFPILGSCAGLIMLDREHLRIMDIRAERNAFGRQLRSFEADLSVEGLGIPPGPPLRGVFIRAPWIAEHGPGVEILARVDGHAVAARQGRVLAVAFHTELGRDDRLHRLLLADVRRADELAANVAGSSPGAG